MKKVMAFYLRLDIMMQKNAETLTNVSWLALKLHRLVSVCCNVSCLWNLYSDVACAHVPLLAGPCGHFCAFACSGLEQCTAKAHAVYCVGICSRLRCSCHSVV